MRIHLGNFFNDSTPIESYKNGNYPKQVRDEAAQQLMRGSIALAQYKEDYMEQSYINNLIEVDLTNMIDELIELRDNAQCYHIYFFSCLFIMKCREILSNKDFDLNTLLQ